MEHKDLSNRARVVIYGSAAGLVDVLTLCGESLSLARQAWLDAFDEEAAGAEQAARAAAEQAAIEASDPLKLRDIGPEALGGLSLAVEGKAEEETPEADP